jgi:hypothetical protein
MKLVIGFSVIHYTIGSLSIMRSIFLIAQAAALAQASGLDYHTMVTFIRCECVEDLNAVRTHLYPIFDNGLMTYALFEWSELDEATFIRDATPAAQEAHESVYDNPSLRPLYMANVTPLQSRGLSPDQVTTELLKKYYKSLQMKTEIKAFGEEE